MQWCLHDPNQFLAVHSAFVYWGEQNMRRVDPAVTASPYWDFHVRVWGHVCLTMIEETASG
jgi:hypothetical protein